MSNSENMTLAERLAQKLKSSSMGELLDEDDLGEICKRAIEEAFFKPHEVRDSYNRVERREPLILGEARAIFRASMTPLIQKAAEDLVADPQFKALLLETAIAQIPQAMLEAGRGMITTAAMTGANDAVQRASELARSGMLGR